MDMDGALSLFEHLANTTHYTTESTQIINSLPSELKNAFIVGDSQELRKVLSGQSDFFDSKTVAQG
jgi:hypothetical protein